MLRTTDSPDEPTSPEIDSTTKGVISLLLFIHLFVLWVVMSTGTSMLHTSMLQDRLVGLFRPYTQPTNLEIQSAPYHLFSGRPDEYEHFFRVEHTSDSGDQTTYQVPGPELGGSWKDPYRYNRLAQLLSIQAELNDDTIPAEIVNGIGQYFIRRAGGGKVSVSCIRRNPQPMELVQDGQEFHADPRDASYENQTYRATVLFDSEGKFQVVKEMAAEHVAPVK